MKAEIHPKVHTIVVKCVCGAEYPTLSTKPEISIDVCSNCHPFYTGQARLMDTEGRVSRFEKKYKHLKDPKPVSTPQVPAKKAVVPKAKVASAPKPAKKMSAKPAEKSASPKAVLRSPTIRPAKTSAPADSKTTPKTTKKDS